MIISALFPLTLSSCTVEVTEERKMQKRLLPKITNTTLCEPNIVNYLGEETLDFFQASKIFQTSTNINIIINEGIKLTKSEDTIDFVEDSHIELPIVKKVSFKATIRSKKRVTPTPFSI